MHFHTFLTTIIAATLSIHTLSAHHGQDFLLAEDYECAAPGQFYLLSNLEWEKGTDGDEFGFSPALWFGLIPQVSMSVEADFRDELTADWKYSSVTPSLHIQLTPPGSKFPIRVGVSAGYQFGTSDGGGEVHAEEPASDDHAEEEHGEHEHEHHAEAEHHHHGGSIHAHGIDAFVGRLVIEGDLSEKAKAVLNIITVAGDETAWGYAAAVRQKVSNHVSIGAEALGDFESDGWHELVAGTYFETSNHFTLKLGVGFGLTEATPDLTVRTGLIWRF